MKIFQSIFVLLLLVFSATMLSAQTTAQEALIQQELKNRGLEEADVRRKLEERGIDIDNMDPSELPGLQSTFEEIEKEIKAEQGASNVASPTDGGPIPVTEAELLEKADKVLDELDGQSEPELVELVEEGVSAGAEIEDVIAVELAQEATSSLPPTSIYGQQLFRDKTLAVFNNSRDIAPSDAYVLGPGDKITVSIWGISQEEATYIITSKGYIKPTGMSRISLKGIPLGKAKKLLERRFSQYYRFRPEEFEVTISETRSLTINIYGEVFNPGGYTFPATNTVFNALVASGGPTDIGTTRQIRLIRDGQAPERIDVYEFMMDPIAKKKYHLEDNDIIHVGIAGKIVSINGAVIRPFKYELLPEENLVQLIEYAGGFKTNAYLNAIQLKRFENNEEKLIDVNLKQLRDSNSDFKLLDGDEIVVKVIPRPYQNFVSIAGAVDFPSKYELTAGDKVSDLIKKGILKDVARKDVAYLMRTREDRTVKYEKLNIAEILSNPSSAANITLEPEDQLTILSKTTFIDTNTFSIGGAVRSPREGQFDPEENMKIEDAVLLAGGLQLNAREEAYIVRTNIANTKEKEYIKFNVRNALINPDSEDNMTIKPMDKIVIYSVDGFTDAYSVSIDGSVRKPGEYPYDDGLRVSDLVYFSNGLTLSATDFAIIHRPDPNNKKKKGYFQINIREALANPNSDSNVLLQRNDRIQVFNKETYTDESTVSIQGAVRKTGQINYDESLTLRDALVMAGGLKIEAASNRIEIFRIIFENNKATKTTVAVLEIDENFAVKGDDFPLKPFDQVVVRTVPEFELQKMVTIRGEVKFPGTYALLDKNERLSSIVSRAGGINTEGFPEGAVLIRASENGNIITRLDEVLKKPKSNTNYILKAGDVIEIPKRKDLVAIKTGNTRVAELYPDKILNGDRINVPYHKGRRARYYVKEYAVGIGENGNRSRITVEYPNGELKRTRQFLFFSVSPKVKEGSIVSVGTKPPKKVKNKEKGRKQGKGSDTDWEKIVASTVAQVTGILSLILLLQQIN